MGLARSQRTSLPFGYWLLWSTKLSIEDSKFQRRRVAGAEVIIYVLKVKKALN